MDNIAIVGMGCLYPNYITKENFWQNMIDGEAFTEKVDFYGKTIERGRIPADGSDAFFKSKFSGEEFAELDKLGDLFKWTAYIVDASLKDAGYYGNELAMARTGMALGIFGLPSKEVTPFFANPLKMSVENSIRTVLDRDDFTFEYSSGPNKLTTRALISDTEPSVYVADKHSLGGPILNLNAACSSPVYSIKIASQYLMSGKADIMLAGAHCYNQLEEAVSGLLELLGLLEDAGSSNPLDRSSKGAIGGSGAGMFVLKRLEDAVRDHDHIYAVIEGVGWSNDGNGKAILAPDATGQMISYVDAYKEGIDTNIDYLECHATGTLAGDLVELHSINSFFGKRGAQPLLGALKGNTGHFFTASTHAAIAKVLLAMEKNTIPMTINVKNPISDRVVMENREWAKKGAVKRAAINSFGFGGTNGHMVVREYVEGDPANQQKRRPFAKDAKMAVVGIGMHIGDLKNTPAFYKSLLTDTTAVKELERERWTFPIDDPRLKKTIGIKNLPKGTYINDYDFDYLEFKMPARGNAYLMRKDFLTLQSAAEAVSEAGIDKGDCPKTAVLINISQDYSELNFSITLELRDDIITSLKNSWTFLSDKQVEEVFSIIRHTEGFRDTPDSVTGIIPSIKASRVSSHWGFKGPTMAMMNGDTGFARSLEIAQYLLSQDIVENVVVGTVELNGEVENIYVQQLLDNMELLDEYGVCEGATVFVLKKPEKAEADGNFVYGTIDAVNVTGGARFSSYEDQISFSLSDSLEDAGARQIGYVEIPASAPKEGSEALDSLLGGKFQEKIEPDELVFDTVERHCGIARGLGAAVAMAKHLLMLSNKIKFAESQNRHQTWTRLGGKRSTLLPTFGTDRTFSSILLSEYIPQPSLKSRLKTRSFIVPVNGSSPEEFAVQLGELEKTLAKKREINPAIQDAWKKHAAKREKDLTLCLIAHNKESLLSEIEQAKASASQMGRDGFSWESFGGSYLTGEPIGPQAKAVCMFPPGELFNSAKFFETLFRFPDLRGFYERYINGSQLAGKGLKGSFLEGNTMELAEVRTALEILKEKFRIQGDFYIGASMGEFAAILATDNIAVESEGEWHAILDDFYALVQFMHDVDPVANDYLPSKVSEWKSYYVSGDRKTLKKLLDEEDLVFESIAGSPRDAIVSGDEAALQRVFKKFHGIAQLTHEAPVSHTPIAKAVYSETTALRLGRKLRFKPALPFTLYDGFTAKPIDPGKDNLVDEIKNIFTETVNFYDMLEATYAAGGRLYIDTSANAICSRWAENTFRGRGHLLISMYPSSHDPEEHFVRTAAKLISHGYSPDSVTSSFEPRFTDKPSFINVIHMSMQHYMTADSEFDILGDTRERLAKIFEEAEGVRPAALNSAEDHALATVRGLMEAIGEASETEAMNLSEANTEAKEASNETTRQNEPAVTEKLAQDSQRSGQEKAAQTANSVQKKTEEAAAQALKGVRHTITKDPLKEPPRPIAAVPAAKEIASEGKQIALPKSAAALAQMGYRAIGNRAMAYSAYLNSEKQILDDIARKLREQSGKPQALPVPEKRPCLWDRDQIITMTRDSMSAVLGPQYETVDSYKIRARMPLPPFLFVSRITAIDAEFGELKPASIEFEYDITEESLFAEQSNVSYILLTESAQIGIFLVAYMGIDEISGGTLRFRIVDTNATLHSDIPEIGQTFRGVYKITSFLKSGGSTLVISTYNVYVDDRLVLTLNGIGGFFTEKDLSAGRGIVEAPKRNAVPFVKKAIRSVPIQKVERTAYTDDELNDYYRGDFERFIPEFDMDLVKNSIDDYIDPRDPEFQEFIRANLPKVKLLDRIIQVDAQGGEFGYGEIIAECDIDEDYWAFKVHFLNDPIFPGSLLMEAIVQAEFFMFMHTGYVLKAKNRRVYPIMKRTIKSSFRGQIRPTKSTITYKITIRDIEEIEERTIYVIDARIYWEGVNVGKAEGFTVCLE
ncbi:MAG: hypothetical protein LBC69_02400 [Eubacteriaceae bacterium]|jgi:acyl transferase domain-containing protein/3-hydroxymyristoyl/3-hydroxydecanoyl-(acyl carrier protein) dehydratase|nr:hypothetical protein [Eubacteriaceae bacterium]